jgi:hypothetical protein
MNPVKGTTQKSQPNVSDVKTVPLFKSMEVGATVNLSTVVRKGKEMNTVGGNVQLRYPLLMKRKGGILGVLTAEGAQLRIVDTKTNRNLYIGSNVSLMLGASARIPIASRLDSVVDKSKTSDLYIGFQEQVGLITFGKGQLSYQVRGDFAFGFSKPAFNGMRFNVEAFIGFNYIGIKGLYRKPPFVGPRAVTSKETDIFTFIMGLRCFFQFAE